MTKKEALEFLELPEVAGDADIKSRLADKLSYYEQLSEKSPSVFLRRIHEQNLAKVKSIQKELPSWSPLPVEKPIPVAEEKKSIVEEKQPVRDLPAAEPVPEIREKIISPEPLPEPAKTVVPEPKKVITAEPTEKTIVPEPKKISVPVSEKTVVPTLKTEAPSLTDTQIVRLKPAPEPVGWLVRHTENKAVKSFPLFFGKNFIGRKIQPGFKPFVEVEDDLFVSRVHAVLTVEGAGPLLFYITDSAAANGGKPSKNGTYVNGSQERVHVKTILHDYDTVQIGETKFVLRFEIEDLARMQEEVEDRGYMHTVVIKVRE